MTMILTLLALFLGAIGIAAAIIGYITVRRWGVESESLPPTDLPDYQQRVIDEKTELDAKRERLEAFFKTQTYQALDYPARALLHRQLEAMTEYSKILGERIDSFNL